MNPIEEHDKAQAERDRLVALYGPDITIGLATDQPQGHHRSADRHACEYQQTIRERQQQDDLELLQLVAAEQDEDEALDLALRITRRGGGRTPPGTMAKAGRALRRRGYTQGSTAERLARMAGQGQGWRAS
jgi:hypothetical protein